MRKLTFDSCDIEAGSLSNIQLRCKIKVWKTYPYFILTVFHILTDVWKHAIAIMSWSWFLTICYYNKELLQTNLTHTINTISYQWMFDFKHGYMYKKYRSPESIPHMRSIISQTSKHDEQDGTTTTDRMCLFDKCLIDHIMKFASMSTCQYCFVSWTLDYNTDHTCMSYD